jgi:hypothetical protein
VPLLLVFVLVTLALFALFLGGGLVAQGYLYQQPAERMPLRALIGGLIVGGFIALWVWVDKGKPGRYDTFFNFAPYTTMEFTEFEAVRWVNGGDGKMKLDKNGNPLEVTAKFKRSAGGKGSQFLEVGEKNAAFKMSGTTSDNEQFMTAALRVKAEGEAEPVRYNVQVKEDPRTKTKTYATDDRKFEEEKGSRYIQEKQLGTLYVPSTGTIVVSLLLNLALLLVWLAACWPVLRFSVGHAIGLAVVGTLVTMLIILPLLFKPNRVPKPLTPPAAARAVGGEWSVAS